MAGHDVIVVFAKAQPAIGIALPGVVELGPKGELAVHGFPQDFAGNPGMHPLKIADRHPRIDIGGGAGEPGEGQLFQSRIAEFGIARAIGPDMGQGRGRGTWSCLTLLAICL